MVHVSDPIIRNIKIAIRFCKKKHHGTELKSRISETSIKHYHNFSILRSTYVYSIFWNCGYVNITKIPSMCEISRATENILSLLRVPTSDLLKTDIHNICASGKFSEKLNLSVIKDKLSKEGSLQVNRNLSAFPALFVKCSSLGTCVLFQNGKYSLVGVNSTSKLSLLLKIITDKIQEHDLSSYTNNRIARV